MTIVPAAAETLTLNSAAQAPYSRVDGTGILDGLAVEAFKRNGLGLSFVKLPAGRGLKNANAGIEDGELVRIAGLEKFYPNLIRVPEKMIDVNFVAFSNYPAVEVDGWNSLEPYLVGFIRGWEIYENNVPQGTRTIPVDTAEQLFTLLEKNRIDVALYTRLAGIEVDFHRKLDGFRIAGKPLASQSLYMYLHKRHSDLVPGISAALVDIKAEGIFNKMLEELMTRNQGLN